MGEEWKIALDRALAAAPNADLVMGHNGIFRNDSIDTVEGSSNSTGLGVEGILRQSADVDEVERRLRDYEVGHNQFGPDEDAHVIGDFIKHVLRELPSSPVPTTCCTALLEAHSRASVVYAPDLPALRKRFGMLVILVLCCIQLGACAVGQEDTTFREISRIKTLVETLQDPDFDARAESAGKEHGSINIESGLPLASSVEAHMGQQQAHGGPRSQRELQQFKLQDQAVETLLTNRHEPLHRFQEESAHSRAISRTLLQDSFGEADALLQFKAEIEYYTDNALDGWTTGNRSAYCSWTRVICDDELHVISLNFSRLKMNGTLGHSLSKLEYLVDLDLSHNFLLSELPVEWGRLQRLQTLNVHDNFLFGGVPAEYGNMWYPTFGNFEEIKTFLEKTVPWQHCK